MLYISPPHPDRQGGVCRVLPYMDLLGVYHITTRASGRPPGSVCVIGTYVRTPNSARVRDRRHNPYNRRSSIQS